MDRLLPKTFSRMGGEGSFEDVVQANFQSLFERGEWGEIIKVNLISEVDPDFDIYEAGKAQKAIIQKGFDDIQPEMGYHIYLDDLERCVEATGVVLDPDYMNSVFSKLVSVKAVGYIGQMAKIMDVKPELSKRKEREAYKIALRSLPYGNKANGTLDLNELVNFMAATETKPPEDLMQKTYKECVDFTVPNYEMLIKLIEKTEMLPKTRTLNKAFRFLVFDRYEHIAEELPRLMELTGENPLKKDVLAAYRSLMKGGHYETLKKLKEVTDVEIPDKLVHSVYKVLFNKGRVDQVMEIGDLTGVMPEISDRFAKKKCLEYVQKGNFKAFSDMLELTAVGLTRSTVEHIVKYATGN
jgi:Ca2+-binding EF-hand superfamily protein